MRLYASILCVVLVGCSEAVPSPQGLGDSRIAVAPPSTNPAPTGEGLVPENPAAGKSSDATEPMPARSPLAGPFDAPAGPQPSAVAVPDYPPLVELSKSPRVVELDVPPADPRAALQAAPPLVDLRTRKTGSDWPTFLGPTGDSRSTETGVVVPAPGRPPRIAWRARLGTGYGIGAVALGRYYQFDREGDKARLACLKSETGELLWTAHYSSDYIDLFDYDNGPRCSPVVDGDRVYLFGAEGMLHCVSAADGRLIWRVDTAKQFGVIQNFFGVGSNPVVVGDLLVVMIGGSPPESKRIPPGRLDLVEPNGTALVAFDKFTGEVKYKLGDELAGYASLKTAEIDGRPWCFAFARGGLVGFDPVRGKIEFHFPWRAKVLESVNASVPVVVGSEVFISETYGPGSALLSVQPGTYRVVWSDREDVRDKAMQTHWNTPIHHEGYLYGSSGRHTFNAELRCVSWKTGEVAWSEPNLTRCSLLYADGYFVCLGEYGTLQLVRATPKKFESVAEIPLPAPGTRSIPGFRRESLLRYPCWAAPILSHGLLYVRGENEVVCLELIPPPSP
jgi:outer membrane protein assembly factor BamB